LSLPKESLRITGKALRRKGLGHRQKSGPLRCANPRIPKKVESGNATLWEALF
jgi:hypothetical protein